jgi:hypothetical protein
LISNSSLRLGFGPAKISLGLWLSWEKSLEVEVEVEEKHVSWLDDGS